MALFAIIKFYSAAPRAEMVVAGNWRILAGAGWRDKSWRSYFSTAYTIVQVSSRSVFARQQQRVVQKWNLMPGVGKSVQAICLA
jgi:hypothetical protein